MKMVILQSYIDLPEGSRGIQRVYCLVYVKPKKATVFNWQHDYKHWEKSRILLAYTLAIEQGYGQWTIEIPLVRWCSYEKMMMFHSYVIIVAKHMTQTNCDTMWSNNMEVGKWW